MSAIVCHITSVHKAKDMRIFYKECVSLANAGYQVKLLVINGESETTDGVEIIGVPCTYSGKLQRFLKAGNALYHKALQINAAIYHFHDPELLWIGYKLIKQGKKVIYDAHEDVPVQILSKAWIPKPFRKILSFLFQQFESVITAQLTGVVTVTDFIETKFLKINANTITAKNYPILSMLPTPGNWLQKQNQICYIGDITKVRGVIEMIKGLENTSAHLALAGNFSQNGLKEEATALKGWGQVTEYGFVDRVKAKEILAASKMSFVLLHPIENYQDALPVKLFEFMAAGIPVIASNLRLQKEIVEGCKCGIVVNVFNIAEIQQAVNLLLSNETLAIEMGNNGRKAVEQLYNWQQEEQKLLAFYTKLLLK